MSGRVKSENLSDVPFQTGVDEDDEVVREIDVLLSPELAQQIYLLQYPLQHTEILSFTEARIKPRHGIIELDQPLPELPQRHYETGEQNMSWITKRTLRSHTISVETHMCLGKLKKGANGTTALHMVPLQHISQMRPSFYHIDAKIEEKEAMDAEESAGDKMDEDGETKPLMFKRKESERSVHARKSSYAYKKASEDSEEFQSLQICEEESMEYQRTIDAVICPTPNQHVLANSRDITKKGAPPKKYVESLNYMPLSKDDPTLGGGSGAFGVNNIKAVLGRLTALLRYGWPIPYSILRDRFDRKVVPDDTIFRALAVCSVMVRGNFCLHSRLVALPSDLQLARTFIMLLLQTKGFVQRERLEMVYEKDAAVSSEKLYVLLNQVAKRTPKGWELRVEDDVQFIQLHPDQSQLYLNYWEKTAATTHFIKLLAKYDQVAV